MNSHLRSLLLIAALITPMLHQASAAVGDLGLSFDVDGKAPTPVDLENEEDYGMTIPIAKATAFPSMEVLLGRFGTQLQEHEVATPTVPEAQVNKASLFSLFAGTATKTMIEGHLQIQQTSKIAVIHCDSFSIAKGETVRIVLPADGTTIIHVRDGTIPSVIDGTLYANGNVWLINPAGVLVGKSGVVQAGGFLASTSNVCEAQFLFDAAQMPFSEGADNPVTNLGTISAAAGGIYLFGGKVENSGYLSAMKGQMGGDVQVIGREVNLTNGSHIKASGPHGGGQVLIGGDYQGKGLTPTAWITAIEANTTISADATLNGDGGKVIVWADGATLYRGDISAKGGSICGNGGIVEVSGKQWLSFDGGVNLTAAKGDKGTLLLDPATITVQSSFPDLNGDSITGDDIIGPGTGIAINDFSGMNSIITSGMVSAILRSSNLFLAATNAIYINHPISWNSAFQLTLYSEGSLNVNSAITNSGSGGVYLQGANGVNINAALTCSALDVAGTATVAANVSTANSQTYHDAVTLTGNRVLTGSTVNISSIVGGGNSLTIMGNANVIGAITGIANFSVSGTSDLGTNVTTSGTQLYSGALRLRSNLTLVGTTITTNGTTAGEGNGLTVSGNAVFGNSTDDAVTGLTSLSVSGTTTINTSNIATTAASGQVYTGAVTLGANTTLQAGAGVINLVSTLNGGFGLTANTTGATTFGGIVGGVNALATLTTDAGGTTVINGGAITTSAAGGQVYNDAVTSATPIILAAGSANNITLSNRNNSVTTISIISANNVTIATSTALAIGASTVSGTLSVTTAGAVTQTAALSVTGLATFNSGSGNNVTLNNVGNNFTILAIPEANNATVTDTGNLTLTTSTIGGMLSLNSGVGINQTGTVSARSISFNSGADVVTIGNGVQASFLNLGDGIQVASGGVRIKLGSTMTLANSQASALSVTMDGGKLAGQGVVGAIFSTTTAGAVLDVGGAGVASLATRNLMLSSGLTHGVDISNSGADQIQVTGSVDLGRATLVPTLKAVPVIGQTYMLVDNDGDDAISGTFQGLQEKGVIDMLFASATYKATVSYFGGSGNDLVMTIIAEPTVTLAEPNEITSTSIRLQGEVNANGLATVCEFEYGTTELYGMTAQALMTPANGTTALPVNAEVGGLQSNTRYYYRLTATNAVGKVNSSGAFFVTKGLPNMIVTGQGTAIGSGDMTPNSADGTDLGDLAVLDAKASRTFTLSNVGDALLNLTDTPKVKIIGAHAGDFKVTAQPASPVAINSTTTFAITFDPTLPGQRTALVSIASDDLDSNPFTFAISGFGRLPTLRPQTITFNPPTTLYLEQSPLALTAYASSGLPVTLSVAGPATLTGNALNLTGAGTVKVTATQFGGGNYKAATSLTKTITVKLNPTVLTLINLNQTYDGKPKAIGTLGALSPVITYKVGTSYQSAAPILAGSYSVKAVAGPVTKTGTLVIAKAPLYVTPDDQRKFAGKENPTPLTQVITGFQNGETAAVLTKAPVLKTTATTASAGGLYPITASGGVAANYTFIYRQGTLVVESFAGNYEALLLDGTPLPVGKLSLTVAASSKTFTGKLDTVTEALALSLLSTALTTNASTEQATAKVTVTKFGIPYVVDITLSLKGDLLATVTKGVAMLGTTNDGRKLSTQTVNYGGAHTAVLEPALPSSSTVPVGAGWATASISSKGVMTLIGKLGDDTAFTSALIPDVDSTPGYRLFVQPYKTGKITRTESYLAGAFSLPMHPTLTNRRYVEQATLTWRKSSLSTDASYRTTFGPVSTALIIDPWLPPAAATGSTPAITLATRLGLTGSSFGIVHTATGSSANDNLPTRAKLGITAATNNLVTLTTPAINTTKWKTMLVPSTGMFTGSFELSDVVSSKNVLRTVTFNGVLRQPAREGDPLVGDGHYLLPPLVGTEKTTGELMLTRP
jgi:filamentous hemagglutinin family protein